MFNEPGDNHFPADDIGLPQLYYVNIIIVALNFVFLVYMSVRKAASSGNIHLIVLMLDVAVGISLASNFFEIIHLSFYAYDGIGSALCDTMSALGEAMCDFIVIFMLISISCGWTLSSSLPIYSSVLSACPAASSVARPRGPCWGPVRQLEKLVDLLRRR